MSDYRECFIQNLIADMKHDGDILVYNISFERSRLNELITFFPKYRTELQFIIDRMRYLMITFKERWYYTPKMKGSYSIKNVLPALVPSLCYDHLEINNGSLASSKFASIHNIKNNKELIETRNHLLKYCRQDTLAIVMILDVLRSV